MASDIGKTLKSPSTVDTNKIVKKLSAKEEEALKGIEEKNSKAGLDVNLRLIASAPTETRARAMINELSASFSQYNYYEYGNSLQVSLQKNSTATITTTTLNTRMPIWNIESFIRR
jgi:hypothetical protein